MAEFSIPPVVIEYGGWWIDVDLKEDPATWAQRTAPQVLSRWGWRGARYKKQLTSVLEGAAEIARKAQDAIGVLLLYPELGNSIRALVRSVPFDLSGHDEDSAWTALLGALTPTEGDGLSARAPEITDISTPAGTCKRLRFEQQLGNENALGEQLAYMWVFPQYGAGVALTTMFRDLAEAGRWRPAIDDLAKSVTLDENAG
jgi:hypothetical protein